MNNLYSILKSRDINLSTKVHLVKAMVFPIVIYGCESWTIKKAEDWRIYVFVFFLTLQYCIGFAIHQHKEKTLESPLECKEIQPVHPKENQSWIFIGRTDAEAGTPILGPPEYWLRQRTDSLEKTWCWERLKAGGEGDDRGWDGWMASPIWRTWVWVSSRSWWWTGSLVCCSPWGSQRVGHDWVIQLN